MGFYPVCPATDQYVIGTPLFKKVTVTLENGKQVVINAPNNSDQNRYINILQLNGKPYGKNWFSHEELIQGTTLDFDMLATPNKQRGTRADEYPYSFSN